MDITTRSPRPERVFAVVHPLTHAVDLIAGADEKLALLRLTAALPVLLAEMPLLVQEC